MRRVVLLIGALMALIVILPTESYACDCVIPESPEAEKENYDGVFSAEVIDIVDKSKNKTIQSSADLLEVKLAVKETWKGVDQKTITIHTERDSASCGFPFEVGEEYLIYAYENGKKWQVNICSRTALLSEATEDLAAFGEGEKPTKQAADDKKAEQLEVDHTTTIILALMGVIVVGVAIGFIKKK